AGEPRARSVDIVRGLAHDLAEKVRVATELDRLRELVPGGAAVDARLVCGEALLLELVRELAEADRLVEEGGEDDRGDDRGEGGFGAGGFEFGVGGHRRLLLLRT